MSLFNFSEFLDLIRENSNDIVRNIRLIDTYVKTENDQVNRSFRQSYCFRLCYESCDRALSWNKSTNFQLERVN